MQSTDFWLPEPFGMAKLRSIVDVLAIGLTLAYPPAVYFGLQAMEPRTLGALLLATIVLRHWQSSKRLAATVETAEWIILGGLCCLALGIVAFNKEDLLLLYPAAVSLSLLVIFGRTLLRPPSMIERIARLSVPDLPSEGVRYTRRVTGVWCGFFVLNAAISLSTLFASREWWLLYNGFVSYLLMGLLFAVEWIVRGKLQRRPA